MTLSPMIGMDGDLWISVPEGRLAPIRTPIGSEPAEAQPCSCCTRPEDRGSTA
jgi:hypothetical protein